MPYIIAIIMAFIRFIASILVMAEKKIKSALTVQIICSAIVFLCFFMVVLIENLMRPSAELYILFVNLSINDIISVINRMETYI